MTTLAGAGGEDYIDGYGNSAAFCNPANIYGDSSGSLYVSDTNNYLMRKIQTTSSCAAGFFYSTSVGCSPTPAGYYSPDGTGLYYACVAGYYSASGTSACSACAANTYSPAASSECLVCVAPRWSDVGASECQSAPTSLPSCQPSTQPSAQPSQPSSQPSSQPTPSPRSSCPAGYYLLQWCHECLPGSYSIGGVADSCTLAPIGTDAFCMDILRLNSLHLPLFCRLLRPPQRVFLIHGLC